VTSHFEVENRNEYLWISAQGTRSRDSILSLLRDILAACAKEMVKKALIDIRAMKGQLEILEAYNLASKELFAMRDRELLVRAAVVDLKENEQRYRFLETVAVNRGLIMRFFNDPREGIEWLTS